jgi:multidrug efflux system membrane fusion protein
MFTYVVKSDSTVEARPLKLGEESGSVMIVQEGIHDGERVVTTNQYRLQPGAHVKVSQAEIPGGQPSSAVAAESIESSAPIAVAPAPGAKATHYAGRSVQ